MKKTLSMLSAVALVGLGACTDTPTAPEAEVELPLSAALMAGGRVEAAVLSPEGVQGFGPDVDDAGGVVGYEWIGPRGAQVQEPVYWAPDGTEQRLPMPPGVVWGSARGISPSGLYAVGYVRLPGDHWFTAALWRRGSVGAPWSVEVLELPRIDSMGNDVNDAGTVVGDAEARGFVWTRAAGYRQLFVSGCPGGTVTGVNSAGWMVGHCAQFVGGRAAVMWRPGGGAGTVLPGLGGLHHQANGINDAFQIVGSSIDAEGVQHAVVWQGLSGVTSLPAVPNQRWAWGEGIADDGTVVGRYQNGRFPGAVLWTPDGRIVDLHARSGLGRRQPATSAGFAVNDAGIVAGYGFSGTSEVAQAMRWTTDLQ